VRNRGRIGGKIFTSWGPRGKQKDRTSIQKGLHRSLADAVADLGTLKSGERGGGAHLRVDTTKVLRRDCCPWVPKKGSDDLVNGEEIDQQKVGGVMCKKGGWDPSAGGRGGTSRK